ncbi:MAG: putative sgc region protein sgcX [Chloroflexi bacterium]|nr:putative sgc region protein sgcX [Chloroflexota bacterium]
MQHDPDVLARLRADLADLTALHAPSGAEQPVIARMQELFTPLADRVEVDHLGNLTATREGPAGAPHIVIAAHADEIGAVVATIEPEGFLRLFAIGGVQPRLLEGRPVWVNGQPGVIGASSGHLAGELGAGAKLENLYVDLGVDDAEAVRALGVQVGDPVVILSELRDLAGTRVAGKGIDNRASCVVLLHILRALKGQSLPYTLTALVAVQEEVGLRGATAAFARLRPDLAIVLDTAPAGGTPDTRAMPYPARIGGGVLIQPAGGDWTMGFLMPRAVRDALIAAAERAQVPYQLAMSKGGVTDAAAAHLAAGGVATLQIQIPRRYSHSPVEVLDLRDLAAALCLTEELLNRPPSIQDLAFLAPSQ